jgi:hypothetical protein
MPRRRRLDSADPIFLATTGSHHYSYKPASEGIPRLCYDTGFPPRAPHTASDTPHATKALRLGTQLQDV